MEEKKASTGTKCTRCGSQNPQNQKYCGNCGKKMAISSETVATGVRPFGALASLHIGTSLYMLLSLIFNGLVQASFLFSIPYALSGLLGFYVGIEFYQGRMSLPLRIGSALTSGIGLVSSLLLFIIGLAVRGVIGPIWVMFALNLWLLRRSRG